MQQPENLQDAAAAAVEDAVERVEEAADAIGLGEFWDIVIEVWNRAFFDRTVGEMSMALLILLIAFALRGVVAHWVVRRLERLAAKTETNFDDLLIRAFRGPIKLVPLVIGFYLSLTVLNFGVSETDPAGRLLRSAVGFAIFWGLYAAVDPFSIVLKPMERVFSSAVAAWIVKAAKTILVLLGGGVILQIWGIPVAPLVASLGIFGVAVALGAQDLFKNLIAGILILAEKRFVPGDWIRVDDVVEGTVEQINFRSTVVRQFDKGPVYVPNSRLSDNAVTNYSRMNFRRIKWLIGVDYRTTAEQLRFIRDRIMQHLLDTPDFARPEETATFVRVDSFGPSSIDFLIYCFTRTTNWGEWLKIKEDFALRIKEIVAEAGSDFAYPTMTQYTYNLEAPTDWEVPNAVYEHSGGPRQRVASNARGPVEEDEAVT
ncbi:MAG: mechanosensitive ion channel family protein [Maricaulaceae bacterium]